MLGNHANPPAHLSGWLRENECFHAPSQLDVRDYIAYRTGIYYSRLLTIIAIHLINHRFMVLHNDWSFEFERRRHLARFFREFLRH